MVHRRASALGQPDGTRTAVTTLTPLGGSLAHGGPSCHTLATVVPQSIVYENRRCPGCFFRLSRTRRRDKSHPGNVGSIDVEELVGTQQHLAILLPGPLGAAGPL